jgi:hypothetical protein
MDGFLNLPNDELMRRTEHNIRVYLNAAREARDIRDFKEARYCAAMATQSRCDLELLQGRTW